VFEFVKKINVDEISVCECLALEIMEIAFIGISTYAADVKL
jgi:hypothetical protein